MKIREWHVQDLGADGDALRDAIVSQDGLEIGRTARGIGCPDDPQMSATHARLFLRDGQAFVEEVGSTTGVWLRVRSGDGCALRVDDQIWLGSQILLIRQRDDAWEIRHHGPDGRLREKHLVPEQGLFLGRTSDLALDKTDSRLSRRHAQIVHEGDALWLYDRGAHNGTYLKLVEPVPVRDGDEFRIATHRFRIEAIPEPAAAPAPELGEEQGRGEGRQKGGLAARLKRLGRRAEPPSIEETAPVAAHPAEEVPFVETGKAPAPNLDFEEEATVLVLGEASESLGEKLPPSTRRENVGARGEPEFEITLEMGPDTEPLRIAATAGDTVLAAVQAAGLVRGEPVDWECGDGGCGVCVVGLVGDAEGLEPPDPAGSEMKTIQITEQVAPDPARYRLACLARVRGNVRLRKL
jgi:pSer/pThr/pTyr-binding forkhead associated (FHA) protein/ferredoxin